MQSFYVANLMFGRPLPGDHITLQNEHQAIGYAHAIYQMAVGKWGWEDAGAVHVYRAPPQPRSERYFTTEHFVAAWIPTRRGDEQGVRLVHPSGEGREAVDADLIEDRRDPDAWQ